MKLTINGLKTASAFAVLASLAMSASAQQGRRWDTWRHSNHWSGGRPMHFRDWHRGHPEWTGNYYYNGGVYWYDPAFTQPAYVDNDWEDIAAASGGVALVGALNNDPTLFFVFAGTAGALYSMSRYDEDRRSGDRGARLRAAYFSKPYFWREGVRYDRSVVNQGGQRYYRFVRHEGPGQR